MPTAPPAYDAIDQTPHDSRVPPEEEKKEQLDV
jgi:hypothetical protein